MHLLSKIRNMLSYRFESSCKHISFCTESQPCDRMVYGGVWRETPECRDVYLKHILKITQALLVRKLQSDRFACDKPRRIRREKPYNLSPFLSLGVWSPVCEHILICPPIHPSSQLLFRTILVLYRQNFLE